MQEYYVDLGSLIVRAENEDAAYKVAEKMIQDVYEKAPVLKGTSTILDEIEITNIEVV
ncbi:MAG: hypothetical protein HOL31_02010 [Candidatus Scalindua sp.]|jgi:hypothetical protein|nr:hypothetical protein [Candidatus Scalindua sp.]MBT7350546.1 hypothetical protein [candidate division WWE3 bacterium]